ncbi:hypothetical protein EXV95_10015 [Acidovorax sp. JMULE5]|nr:hypothetical protein EXV95_10015 [Acidovorax sp. JMULE5]
MRVWSSTSLASSTRTCCAGVRPWRLGRRCRCSPRRCLRSRSERAVSQWVDARIAHPACSLHLWSLSKVCLAHTPEGHWCGLQKTLNRF